MSTTFNTTLQNSFMVPQWVTNSPDFSNKETIDAMLKDIYPDVPLLYLMSNIRSKSITDNNMFSWFMSIMEEIEGLNIYAGTGGIACASSTHGTAFTGVRLTINSSGSLTNGDVGFLTPGKVITFFVNNYTTQINFLVTAVTNKTTFNLKLLTNTPGVNVVATDYAYLSGNLFSEGSDFATDYYTMPFRRYGSLQRFQNDIIMTTDQMKQAVKYEGSILEKNRKDQLARHQTEIEKTLLWSGTRYGNGNNVYGYEGDDAVQVGTYGRETKTTSIYQLATLPASSYRDGKARAFYQPKSETTIGKLQSIVDTITNYQRGSIIWICGRAAKQHICDVFSSGYPNFLGIRNTTIGNIDLSVNQITTRDGIELNLIEHPLLKHGVLSNQIYSLDLDYATLMKDFTNQVTVVTPDKIRGNRYEEQIQSKVGWKIEANEATAFIQLLGD